MLPLHGPGIRKSWADCCTFKPFCYRPVPLPSWSQAEGLQSSDAPSLTPEAERRSWWNRYFDSCEGMKMEVLLSFFCWQLRPRTQTTCAQNCKCCKVLDHTCSWVCGPCCSRVSTEGTGLLYLEQLVHPVFGQLCHYDQACPVCPEQGSSQYTIRYDQSILNDFLSINLSDS